jgi:uncharacterized protein YjiS (DUF1127 family)
MSTDTRFDISKGRPPGIDQPEETNDEDLSIGTICHLLQNQRRRRSLRYLREADGQVRLSDLAETIAATENDTTVEQLRYEERKRVYISLYQLHLPKLADAGVVDYDADRGTIEPRPLMNDLYAAYENLTAGASNASTGQQRTKAFVLVAVLGFAVLWFAGIASIWTDGPLQLLWILSVAPILASGWYLFERTRT